MQLYEKFGKDGLAVVMLSEQAESEVKNYAGDNSIPFTVAVTKPGVFQKYKIRGYPSSFLIDGNGEIVWEGHPMALREAQVEAVMDTVQLFRLPEVPASLKSAKLAFEAQKFGDAAKKAESRRDSRSASQEDKDAAHMILDEVGKVAAKKMEKAEAAVAKGDYPRAFETLKYVQVRFSGLDAAKKAKARDAELKKDPAVKKELSAHRLLDRYLAALEREKSASKRKGYIPALEAFARKYEGTHAAAKAAQAVRSLKSER